MVDMASGVNEGHGIVVLSRVDAAPPCELGCTTLQACNYNEDATNDDGTCDYCFCVAGAPLIALGPGQASGRSHAELEARPKIYFPKLGTELLHRGQAREC